MVWVAIVATRIHVPRIVDRGVVIRVVEEWIVVRVVSVEIGIVVVPPVRPTEENGDP
jgi:hypothetical protein